MLLQQRQRSLIALIYDLTVFHSFSYSSITDENVKGRLTTDYSSLWGPTGGTEEALSDKDPDIRHFQALNVFASGLSFPVGLASCDEHNGVPSLVW